MTLFAHRVARGAIALGLALSAFACGARAAEPRPHARRLPAPSQLAQPAAIGAAGTRLQRAYSGAPVDVTGYHYDDARTGWNPSETDLTVASVGSSRFGLLATLEVDGNVLAQPLLVSGFRLPDGTRHDVLIVATGHNTVYAFDANSYAVLWQRNLGPSQSSYDVGCDDIVQEYGISATPVIVRHALGKATLYVVAATEPAPYSFATTLHALDLGTGQDAFAPATLDPSAILPDGGTLRYDPQNQYVRAGLAWRDGAVYVPVGSHCDHNLANISGWLLRYSGALTPRAAFHTVNATGGLALASIWMTGFAPAIDADGDVFVVTGNGNFTRGQRDWGQSVLKLSPSLAHVLGHFTPAGYDALNADDTDFGSGGVMLLPPLPGQAAPPLAVAMGKASQLYLLNQTALGGAQAGDKGALQAQPGGGNGLWGGPAYWNGPAGPEVFTQTDGDVLHAWTVNAGATPSLTRARDGTVPAGYGGSLPIVSSNGATPGSGVVWLIDRAQEPFALEAYNAETLGAPIFAAQIGTWSNAGQGNPFLTPMVANGRVYAPGSKLVRVFGLTP